MRNYKFKKGLIIGIIFLFVGIAFQPAVAVTPNATESEDECNLCPKINNQQITIFKSLIYRLERQINKLSVLSKQNPIMKRKYQEISDGIATLKEMNVESNSDDYPKICDFLGKLVSISGPTFLFVAILLNYIRATGLEIIYLISTILSIPIVIFTWIPLIAYFGIFDCYDFYPYI